VRLRLAMVLEATGNARQRGSLAAASCASAASLTLTLKRDFSAA
jgi:hypothetical protein